MEQTKVKLALSVLRRTLGAEDAEVARSDAVRLALRVLVPHCPERWPLDAFWEGALGDHPIGRAQSMTAAFNGIVRQLRRSGAYR